MKRTNTAGTWIPRILMVVAVTGIALLTGCTQHIAKPDQLATPQPIDGNDGEYLCSITKDMVLAEWSDKMANVSLGASIGRTAGAVAGSYALRQIPFVGGFLGDMAGKAIGRKIAIESAGGMDFIKKTSDLSFATPEDMALYLYTKYYGQEHYAEAIKAEMELYPEFKEKYVRALVAASAEICRTSPCETLNDTICQKGPCQ